MAARRHHPPIWLLLLAPALACGAAVSNDAQRARGPVRSGTESRPEGSQDSRAPASAHERRSPAGEQPTLGDEIAELDNEIRDWSHEMGLGADSSCSRGTPDVPCVPPAPESCSMPAAQVPAPCREQCSLGERICENTDEICERASHLDDNTWAADKCASAKGRCRAATHRCCSCGRGGNKGSPPMIL